MKKRNKVNLWKCLKCLMILPLTVISLSVLASNEISEEGRPSGLDSAVTTQDRQDDIKSKIIGRWRLSSDKEAREQHNYDQIKVITEDTFMWFGYDKDSKVIQSGASGSYTFDGTDYIEMVEFATPSVDSYIGKRAVYKDIVLEGDKMIINGYIDDSLRVYEVWERIKE